MLTDKKCDAIPIANDLLHRAQAHGVVKAEQYRSIYKSPKLPPGAYGYVYNLTPELASKVRSAFFTFEWKGTGLEKAMGEQMKFVPIDYKKDWEYVRGIDQKVLSWAR
jgi:phosphonate transport system substrate-binding protein